MSEKYSFIDAEKAHYPIVKMCGWLTVSTSGFYAWRDRPASTTARRRAAWPYSSRRSSTPPTAPTAIAASTPRCCGRAKTAGPSWSATSCGTSAWGPASHDRGGRPRPSLVEAGQTIPDLVGRDFTADAPGTTLVGDITYLPTWQGFSYLATVIDCCTKECIGYAIADHMRAELVIDALRMAARNYPLAPEAIFHSDRGSQGGFNRSSQHFSIVEVFDGASTAAADRALRPAMRSPGRPIPARHVERAFWRLIAQGKGSEVPG